MKIFLDIDGVMVHANPAKAVEFAADGFYKFNNAAVEALQSVCTGPSVEVILSTSHRFTYAVEEWRQIFNRRGIDIKELSIIETPDDIRKTRKESILSWIETRQLKTAELIIIDDDRSLNGLPEHLKSRLILTNPYIGLTFEVLNQVMNGSQE